jgi:hypothetical protein
VLAIHRVAGPGGAGLSHAQEVDFSLPDNDLRWQDVRALPVVAALVAESPGFEGIAASFRLAMRRISGSVGHAGKLSLYYALAEKEPAR